MVNRVRWKKNEQLGWLLLSDNALNRFLWIQTFEFKIKRYREKFDFLKRLKKVFSNRRKNNDLSDRVKKKNCFQNMIK